jgi:hypothetical protein
MIFGKDLLSYSIWDIFMDFTSKKFVNFKICTYFKQDLSLDWIF